MRPRLGGLQNSGRWNSYLSMNNPLLILLLYFGEESEARGRVNCQTRARARRVRAMHAEDLLVRRFAETRAGAARALCIDFLAVKNTARDSATVALTESASRKKVFVSRP